VVSFEEAFEIVISSARRLGTEHVSILDNGALNRVLREDIASDIDIPPFNKSAMDGFACRRADLGNELTVIEAIAAGWTPKRAIGRNQCAKIMTGAVVPEGADCVVMVEYAKRTGENKIEFTGDSTQDNIRHKGEDAKKGDLVLHAGELIRAQHIAVLASIGCVEPLVSARPSVGIVATGDELVAPTAEPAPWQIRNSNSYQLSAQTANVGVSANNYGIVADTKTDINAILKRALSENDVLILSGGVSVGDYDFVKDILRQNRVNLLLERVAVKPGRPMVFGVSDEGFCFGLPGNPVSTFIMFELFVRPFLFKMMGHDFEPVVSQRQLKGTITRKNVERDSWLPVAFTGNSGVVKVEYHGSAHINALCKADGLLCIPAGVAEVKEGTTVAVRQI